ncbi:MAG: hypothetical protein BWK78_04845 [Thiotrichaceae bacterium IS1]|nr:MAG: hypothetical protein BWK78_04845 [Thiotrichaceae bacterium IS1]
MAHWRKQTISFFVSSTCNLACTYCYIPKLGKTIEPQDSVIDIDFAVAGMKDFFAWSKSSNIRFFSAGEATTEFDTMVKIRNEAYKLVGDKLKVELQTNGYFSGKIADWIWENIDILWISVDGMPDVQNRQRPTVGGRPSSDIVLRNVERFAKHTSMQFGVRLTFAPGSFHRQIEMLEYFKDMGVRYVCGAPAYSSPVNRETNVPVLLEFAQHFVPAFFKAQEMGIFYQTHLIVNFDEKVTSYCRACTTPICPQLTSDGYVSCCDWASFGPKYLPGSLQQCIYGKWDKEKQRIIYFEDKKTRIENRNVKFLGEGDCKNCEVLEHCAGGCIGKVMAVTGDLHRMDPNWCGAVRYLAQHIPLNSGLYPVRHS